MRKASCLICDNQFARQKRPYKVEGETFWPLVCSACGAVFMSPDVAIDPAKAEHPEEAKALDGDYRKFRLALGEFIQSGSVLLVTDPLNQHAQMAFTPGVTVREMSWTQLENPEKLLKDVPRDTALPESHREPVDWVVWWHGLEHTRRPAAHLRALGKVAKEGLIVGMPSWPRLGFQRLALMGRYLPQHRFLAGPEQMKRLGEEIYWDCWGPLNPADLGETGAGKAPRWLYRLSKKPVAASRVSQ